MRASRHRILSSLVFTLLLTLLLPGCDRDPGTSLEILAPQDVAGDLAKAPDFDRIEESGDQTPAGIVEMNVLGSTLRLWPYTGVGFSGSGVDPINVVFVGQADPLQIRAALTGLSGDRTSLGLPDMPPFNQPWVDAVGGDVQVTWSDGPLGWTGGIIQLTAGDYGPLRLHLRLFATENPWGDGVWTLGGAHFELQIPGTNEHQPLSWELAEQIVVGDMMRTGLLDPGLPALPSGPINAAPSWRAIDAMIYNLLPPEMFPLLTMIGLPLPPVDEDVPIPSDGQAMVLQVAQAAPVTPGSWSGQAVVDFDQTIPRPFCMDGPLDVLQVTGKILFTTRCQVDGYGRFQVASGFDGLLSGQPLGLSDGGLVPVGDAITARVHGDQRGFLSEGNSRLVSYDRRMTFGEGGAEMVLTQFTIPERGRKFYRVILRCFGDESED